MKDLMQPDQSSQSLNFGMLARKQSKHSLSYV